MADEVQVSSDAVQRTEEYRRRKQTAVLVIAFSDIVGSTELLESMGEQRYGSLLDDHKARVEKIATRDDAGSVVQFMGDGALSVFSEPSTAVERCVELSQSSSALSLRIGLDLGQVAKKEAGGTVQDIFGRHVHRAARVLSAAQPGEVLTTFQVYDCAVGWLRDTPIAWDDRGLHALKGFTEPVHLFAARNGRLRSDAAPVSPDQRCIRFSAGNAYQPRRSSGPRDPFSFLDFPVLGKLQLDLLRIANLGVDRKFEGPLTLLWVDDFPENNRPLFEFLQHLGLVIETVRDTIPTLQSLEGRRYAAIVTDIGRPSSPSAGLDLLRALRERGDETPVVVYASTTSIATYGDEARALGAHTTTSGAITLLAALKSILSATVDRS